MLTIPLPSKQCTNPRTNGPLLRSGVRAAILLPGMDGHTALSAVPPLSRFVSIAGHRAKVTEVRLTYIDGLTERDLLAQADPAWRTPEGAEAGMLAQFGFSFGPVLTLVHFEIV